MTCWLCLDKCDNICCDCPGSLKNAHINCIGYYSFFTKNYKCKYCNKAYKINLYYKILIFIYWIFERLTDTRYYNGKKWLDDEEYDEL